MNRQSPPLKILISKEQIAREIEKTAQILNLAYRGKTLLLVAVLKGAIPFLSDLMRQLTPDIEIALIRASSYGQRGTRRGELEIEEVGHLDCAGKDLLILDDIFDSGATLQKITNHLKEKNPKSVKTCVLLKKKRKEKSDFNPDYALFEIEDHFVIGYGLDYKEKYRHLPGIYIYSETQELK